MIYIYYYDDESLLMAFCVWFFGVFCYCLIVVDFVERNPPINEVVQSGVVPRIVQFLSKDDFSQLQVSEPAFFHNLCVALCFDLYADLLIVCFCLYYYSLRRLGHSQISLQGHLRTLRSLLIVGLSRHLSNFSVLPARKSENRYQFRFTMILFIVLVKETVRSKVSIR